MKIIALNKGEKNGIIKKEKGMHQNEYYGAFFILLIFCNKKDRLNCAVLFKWYPQANSNRCLHRERVLS